VDVPVCAKLLQPAPWQRSTKYWLMVPPVSVDAVQDKLICAGPVALAARLPGAVGEFTGVVALAVFEYALKLFEASVARTL
jgi:hypothetical protein